MNNLLVLQLHDRLHSAIVVVQINGSDLENTKSIMSLLFVTTHFICSGTKDICSFIPVSCTRKCRQDVDYSWQLPFSAFLDLQSSE